MDNRKTTIHFTGEDTRRIAWLRKHFGGIGQGAVITMALKTLYAQQKAPHVTYTTATVGSTGPFIQNVTVPEEQK
jgi:hypothetical protein